MDSPLLEKLVPFILMIYDNKMMTIKNAYNNTKSSRHVKIFLKFLKKLRKFGEISVTYNQTDKNLSDSFKKTITECDRNCIEGDRC